jgi:hypothetical protein
VDAHTPGTEEEQARCWTSVPVKVTSNSNEKLTRNLTLGEIHNAISALPKGKALGHDGLPMEFFHECAEEIALTFFQAFTSMLNTIRT